MIGKCGSIAVEAMQMAITTKESILKVLTAYNPWWKTGMVNPKLSRSYKRFAFYEAMKRMDQVDIRRTIVLTGTRRVGKTTIQYQMIEALLARGVAPQKIVFTLGASAWTIFEKRTKKAPTCS